MEVAGAARTFLEALATGIMAVLVVAIAHELLARIRCRMGAAVGSLKPTGRILARIAFVAGFGVSLVHASTSSASWWALPSSDYPTKAGYQVRASYGHVPTSHQMDVEFGLFHTVSFGGMHRLAGSGWDQWGGLDRILGAKTVGPGLTFAYAVSAYRTVDEARVARKDLDPALGLRRGPRDGQQGLSVLTVTRVVDHDSYGMLNFLSRGRFTIEQWCLVQDLRLRRELGQIAVTYCAKQRVDLEAKLGVSA